MVVSILLAVAFHLGEVSHAAQQRVGYAGRSSAAPADFCRRFTLYGHLQQVGTALYDAAQGFWVVVLQMQVDAETRPKRSGKQSAAGGSPHERKGIEVYLYAAGRGAFVYHDIYTIVFHGPLSIMISIR